MIKFSVFFKKCVDYSISSKTFAVIVIFKIVAVAVVFNVAVVSLLFLLELFLSWLMIFCYSCCNTHLLPYLPHRCHVKELRKPVFRKELTLFVKGLQVFFSL